MLYKYRRLQQQQNAKTQMC